MIDDDGGTGAEAADRLLPLVYGELKRIAHHQLRTGTARATLCTTELVHEAWLRLAQQTGQDWDNRAHFFGAASRAMRQVLVDFARRRQASKRGGDQQSISLRYDHAALEIEIDELLSLEDALVRLDDADRRLAQVVELRFFGGLDVREVAELLRVTKRPVEPPRSSHRPAPRRDQEN